MSDSSATTKKRKLSLPVVIAGGVSSLVLALGMSPTFSAFTAQITNSINTTSAGTLIMTETQTSVTPNVVCHSTDGSNVATNAATCSTINKYGGSQLVPGGSDTETITIKNDGTLTPSAFTLTPGANCTQTGAVTGSATDLCAKLTLVITQDGTSKFNGALSTFLTTTPLTLATVAPGGTSTFTFKVTLDSGVGNTYQGLTANQSLIWKFQV